MTLAENKEPTQTSASILEVKGASLSLESLQILKDVSFTIQPGEKVALIGPNGAGKTTLLRIIARIIKPTSGSAYLFGNPIENLPQKTLARSVAHVPQFFEAVFELSVREFVSLSRYPHSSWWGNITKKDDEVITQALQLVEIETLSARLIHSLSGGELRRALLAAALAQEPKLLLLDEVSSFLDPRAEEELFELLNSIHKTKNITILSVSHHLNHIALHFDRVIALKKGNLIFDGPPSTLMKTETLSSIFDYQPFLVPHPKRNISMILPA